MGRARVTTKRTKGVKRHPTRLRQPLPRSLLSLAAASARLGGRPRQLDDEMRAAVRLGFDWLTSKGPQSERLTVREAYAEIARRLQIKPAQVRSIIYGE